MNLRRQLLVHGANLQGQGGIALPNCNPFHLGCRPVIAGHSLDLDVSVILNIKAGNVVRHFVAPSIADCVKRIPCLRETLADPRKLNMS